MLPGNEIDLSGVRNLACRRRLLTTVRGDRMVSVDSDNVMRMGSDPAIAIQA